MSETKEMKRHILERIRMITDKAKKSNLSETFFIENNSELEEIASYFNTTSIQALLISATLAYNFKSGAAGIDDLSDFFDVNSLHILEFKSEIDELIKKGILMKVFIRGNRHTFGLSNIEYYVPDNISEAIMLNNPIPQPEPEKIKDVFDLLEAMYTLRWDSDDIALSSRELIEKTMEIINEYSKFSIVKKLKLYELSYEDIALMLYLFWRYVNGVTDVDMEIAINGIYSTTRRRFEYTKALLQNQHPLIAHGLVEVQKRRFGNDSIIQLTNKSVDILMSDNLQLLLKKERREDIILPSEIKQKKLIHGEREFIQLNQLRKSLMDDNLKSIQERMKSKGLPEGFTVLFYGAPGTGKTESVYQIARETGREIMFVDISKTKSFWFGESEKLIKKAFTDYNTFKKDSDLCPILLFNEADGILSKRKASGSSNVAQTENAIQNIILQEIETFSGILMATTNLVANFDKAFERRFLYKIEFSKPDTEIRSQIWKLKLAELSKRDAHLLAEQFEFSGGQIDNIVRKFEIVGILENRKPTIDELIIFCNEELFEKNIRQKIGYRN